MAKNQYRQHKKDLQLPTDISSSLMPQAVELEYAVLGALLLEGKSFLDVEDILKPNDFYVEAHQLIYKAICHLNSKRKPIDMLTVVEELKSMGELQNIGGAIYIAELTEKVASAAHIDYHSRIIKQKSLARELIGITSNVQSKAYDDSQDISEIMEELEKSFTELVSGSSSTQSIMMPDALTKAMNIASEVQEQREQGIDLSITTGLQELNNEIAGGWHAPDLIVLGARPSMGKTQHALNFAKAAGMKDKHVFFVSIEMTATQLVNRYLLEDERISNNNLRTGRMSSEEWAAIDQRAGELWNMKLHIADSPDIRFLNNIRSEARRLHRKGQLHMMIIDYLGLIRTNLRFDKRYLEIGYITGELKNLCKELNIPIILLAQLNRPQKGTIVKEPQLDDLRESGDIEQDADMVLFIHKPDYYDPAAEDSKGEKWKNRGKLIIAKYREGSRNQSVIFYHDNRYKKIWDKYDHIEMTKLGPEHSPINPNYNFEEEKGDTPF